MCGVIVVDAERSRSTNLGCDVYIHDHCLGYHHIICCSINCPTVICLPTVAIFSREATSEIYGRPVYFPIIYFHIHIANCIFFYLLLLFSDLYYQKPKNTLLCFIYLYLHLSIYYNFILSLCHFLALLPERD